MDTRPLPIYIKSLSASTCMFMSYILSSLVLSNKKINKRLAAILCWPCNSNLINFKDFIQPPLQKPCTAYESSRIFICRLVSEIRFGCWTFLPFSYQIWVSETMLLTYSQMWHEINCCLILGCEKYLNRLAFRSWLIE